MIKIENDYKIKYERVYFNELNTSDLYLDINYGNIMRVESINDEEVTFVYNNPCTVTYKLSKGVFEKSNIYRLISSNPIHEEDKERVFETILDVTNVRNTESILRRIKDQVYSYIRGSHTYHMVTKLLADETNKDKITFYPSISKLTLAIIEKQVRVDGKVYTPKVIDEIFELLLNKKIPFISYTIDEAPLIVNSIIDTDIKIEASKINGIENLYDILSNNFSPCEKKNLLDKIYWVEEDDKEAVEALITKPKIKEIEEENKND